MVDAFIYDAVRTPCGRGRASGAVATLETLVAAGRTGKVDGGGVYDHTDAGVFPWPGLVEHFGQNDDIDAQDVADRLLITQSLEAHRAMQEGVVSDTLAADAAASMGWGYPAHLGGPFAYVESMGVYRFVARCDQLAERNGSRFAVPDSLRSRVGS